jgi:hypothetical protein
LSSFRYTLAKALRNHNINFTFEVLTTMHEQ